MKDKLEAETGAKLLTQIIKTEDIWWCAVPRDWHRRPSSEKPLESPHMHFLPLVHSKESDLLLAESLDHQHCHSVIPYLDYSDI